MYLKKCWLRLEVKKKMSESSNTKMDRTYYIIVTVSSLILFYMGVLTRHGIDYGTHISSMEITPLRPLLNPLNWFSYFRERGYPLWHITGHFFMRVFNCPADYAGGINSGVYLVLSYIGVIKIMKYLLAEVKQRSIAILSFVLLIVAPVWLPWINKYIVLHVGGVNVWHNATNICGRAIGILAFYFSMRLLDNIVESDYVYLPSLKDGILLAFLYLMSLLAKPSFAQTFAPAFGLLLIFQLIKSKGKFLKQFLAFAAIAIFPALRLGFQFFRYFGTAGGSEVINKQIRGVRILVELPASNVLANVLKSQFLVLLFPILMVIVTKLAKRKLDRYHAISWLMELLGVCYVLFLKGAAAGEMGWAYYIAEFFVFLVGIRDYMKIFYSEESFFSRSWVQITLFTLSTLVLVEHTIIGGVYLHKMIVGGARIF